MIKKAQENERQALIDIFSQMYDPLFAQFYFDQVYKPFNTYVIRQDDQIACTLSVNRRPMMLNGKKISASCLTGFYASMKAREQGLMEKMLDEVIEELSYNDLVTIAHSAKAILYEPVGFRPIYDRNSYLLTRAQVPTLSESGIITEMPAAQLTEVYRKFVAHFDGFLHRDRDCYEKVLKSIAIRHHKLAAYQGKDGEIEGYLIYHSSGQTAVVTEIIYLNSKAFLKLISHALNTSDSVRLSLSQAENITKMIPTAIFNKESFVMARINDYALFNRLYGSSVRTVEGAFKLGGKPLYLCEFD